GGGCGDAGWGKRLRELTAGAAANVLSLALSPEGSRLAAGQGVASRSVEPCDVLVWDVKTGRQVLALRGHVNGVAALDFHPGGKQLASGGNDGAVRLWELGAAEWSSGLVRASMGERRMHKIVLLRHGQSSWNLENRFTGWTDVDLSEAGVAEARAAGRLLREGGFDFDRVWTSVLKRAIRTAWLVLEE